MAADAPAIVAVAVDESRWHGGTAAARAEKRDIDCNMGDDVSPGQKAAGGQRVHAGNCPLILTPQPTHVDPDDERTSGGAHTVASHDANVVGASFVFCVKFAGQEYAP